MGQNKNPNSHDCGNMADFRLVTYCAFLCWLVPCETETLHTIPPVICKQGKSNTTGRFANTEYDVIEMPDCTPNRFPKFNCTTLPGSPMNVAYNGSGYNFGLQWNASYGAGGDISNLKGFKVKVTVTPSDGVMFYPQKCLYINITNTRKSQYVLGRFYFQCNYAMDGEIETAISSYPTPDLCPVGGLRTQEPIKTFFVPIPVSTDLTTSTPTHNPTLPTTRNPSTMTVVVITTVLSCSLVFVLILVAVICMWKKPWTDKYHRWRNSSSFQPHNSSQDIELARGGGPTIETHTLRGNATSPETAGLAERTSSNFSENSERAKCIGQGNTSPEVSNKEDHLDNKPHANVTKPGDGQCRFISTIDNANQTFSNRTIPVIQTLEPRFTSEEDHLCGYSTGITEVINKLHVVENNNQSDESFQRYGSGSIEISDMSAYEGIQHEQYGRSVSNEVGRIYNRESQRNPTDDTYIDGHRNRADTELSELDFESMRDFAKTVNMSTD